MQMLIMFEYPRELNCHDIVMDNGVQELGIAWIPPSPMFRYLIC